MHLFPPAIAATEKPQVCEQVKNILILGIIFVPTDDHCGVQKQTKFHCHLVQLKTMPSTTTESHSTHLYKTLQARYIGITYGAVEQYRSPVCCQMFY
ncbi:hypothetical protein O9929_18815 [Vibrio lentus]|nr:hypothetical protein [Vibrio lentus]